MPFVVKRQPLYTLATDAAAAALFFFYPGALLVFFLLPVLALAIGVVLLLQGPGDFRNWRPGPGELIVGAAVVGVIFLAGLLLGIIERLAGRGYVWIFQEDAKCDERAVLFVERLLSGKRRLAYQQLHETARERTSFAEFDAEWKAFALSPDMKALRVYAEGWLFEGHEPPIAPHRYGPRLRESLAVVEVQCDLEGGKGRVDRLVRVDLVRAGDDWSIVGWSAETDDEAA